MALGAIAGPLISAAGSLLGGLFGGESQKVNDNQLAQSWTKMFHQVAITAQDAKDAGLHPLSVLGSGAPNYSPANTQLTNSGLGAGIAGAGDALAAIFNKMKTPEEQARERAETDLLTAQADQIRMQSGRLQTDIVAASRGGPTGKGLAPGQTTPPSVYSEIYGEPVPGSVNVKMPGGQIQTQPNMDVSADAETSLWQQVENGTILPYLHYLGNINTPKWVLDMGTSLEAKIRGKSATEIRRNYDKEIKALAAAIGRYYQPRYPGYRTGGSF